jgi:hypothetical protein
MIARQIAATNDILERLDTILGRKRTWTDDLLPSFLPVMDDMDEEEDAPAEARLRCRRRVPPAAAG